MARSWKLTSQRLSDALAWRVRRLVGDQRLDRAIVRLAQAWRPHLHKPVFIGIAGSAGKTTTKELLQGVLSYRRRGLANPSSLNALPEVAKVVLRLRASHDFCIAELSEDKPGIMDAPLALLRPSVGIVTVIGNDHWSAFGSREGIARETGKLVAALPASGTAVLNADDAAVLAMAQDCAARVITYGTSPQASLRAQDVRSVWPERLQMTLTWGAERAQVRTQLCGTHLLPTVLGAIGGGLAAGLSLADCVDGIASVQAFDGRMQPVTTADGVSFIRDDFKAPLWTLDACFEFMKSAHARRKIIVIGTLSDYGAGTGASRKYADVARRALEIADLVVFVGPWAPSTLKAAPPGSQERLRAFSQVRDAAQYLMAHATAQDLVLLKGTNKQDHLQRLILARDGGVACWRDDCDRQVFCNDCPQRHQPSGHALPVTNAAVAHAPAQPSAAAAENGMAGVQVIVGLGNPEPQYANTPHNVGYELVDRLAAALGLSWSTVPDAWIARGDLAGCRVCLVKIRLTMNTTGVGLRRLSQDMGFNPGQCVLVLDDLALPIGAVKARQHGGAGGHRGLASILEAFQSDGFRRIKIGVGQAGARAKLAEYVLTPFDAPSRSVMDTALTAAIMRLSDMLAQSAAMTTGALPART